LKQGSTPSKKEPVAPPHHSLHGIMSIHQMKSLAALYDSARRALAAGASLDPSVPGSNPAPARLLTTLEQKEALAAAEARARAAQSSNAAPAVSPASPATPVQPGKGGAEGQGTQVPPAVSEQSAEQGGGAAQQQIPQTALNEHPVPDFFL
jgi:hypothetical protein